MARLKKIAKKEKDYFLTIVVVMGIFILTLLLDAVVMPDGSSQRTMASLKPMPYEGRAHVIAIDQHVTDKKFKILSAALFDPGFIVVQETKKGVPGKIIGQTNLLQPGLYLSRTIPLIENPPSDAELLVSLYTDNGDGIFTPPIAGQKGGDTLEPAHCSPITL